MKIKSAGDFDLFRRLDEIDGELQDFHISAYNVDDFLFGSVVADPACFLIFHYISVKICRCGYDRFSFTASDNLYCKVKYRHDTIPPFCRIRH